MILKTSKQFKPKTFARKTGHNGLQALMNVFTLNPLSKESFEDEFCERYNSCPEALRQNFHLINDVSCDKARHLLMKYADELDIYHKELNNFELACFIFQRNQRMIIEIFQWLNIDSTDNFKEFDGIEPKEPNENNLDLFKEDLSTFFSEQGKGNQIEIDIYKKSNKIAYIINHGSHIKNEYIANDEKNSFEIIKQRKANAIILVYLPKLARLRMKVKDFKVMNFIKDKFAEHLLQDENFFEGADKKQYFDLERLLEMKKSDFITNPEYGIADVDFTRIEGNLYEDEKIKNCLASREGLLNKLGDKFDSKIEYLMPKRIHLQFKFEQGNGQARTIQFAQPNISNLNESSKDLIIEKCLKSWEVI